MKFHVQVECTVDVVVESPTRGDLAMALGNFTEEEFHVLIRRCGGRWEYFIDPSGGHLRAKLVLEDGKLVEAQ